MTFRRASLVRGHHQSRWRSDAGDRRIQATGLDSSGNMLGITGGGRQVHGRAAAASGDAATPAVPRSNAADASAVKRPASWALTVVCAANRAHTFLRDWHACSGAWTASLFGCYIIIRAGGYAHRPRSRSHAGTCARAQLRLVKNTAVGGRDATGAGPLPNIGHESGVGLKRPGCRAVVGDGSLAIAASESTTRPPTGWRRNHGWQPYTSRVKGSRPAPCA